ncbi:hypothetical protein KMW28_04860 [Flammeovirga yaeyamensis]|uniref:Lipoprotein n=1 Tax=Flammeovirga yaeyamensis TaxID=367791 RepID=A0AAX1NA87_9BACT|nr:hypothetical protein [Flammeovirga yaeyamensis]MBB3697487.1 hypothetical protein [Flammeovirga yaeyamensis]NMF36181.1 hypothetical protein [Flammeovirga yaeyamensis]QWG02913.1 hypothetical protein KMW28_04860 [Flammeovirga yaeyamensis]
MSILKNYNQLFIVLFCSVFSSCGIFDQEDDEQDNGIEVFENVYTVDLEYIIKEPEASDLKRIEFFYNDDFFRFSDIIQYDQEDNIRILVLDYVDNSLTFESIKVLDGDANELHQYLFSYSGNTTTITKDGIDYLNIQNSEQVALPYRIQNFKEGKTYFYTYEEGTLKGVKTYNTILENELFSSSLNTTFEYLEFGNSMIYGTTNFTQFLTLDNIEDYKLTKHLVTDLTKPTLNTNFFVASDSTRITYRSIFNEEKYPINISMINYDKELNPTQQIVHIISYDPLLSPY